MVYGRKTEAPGTDGRRRRRGGSDPGTGPNDGATLVMTNCANLSCHSPGGDGTWGGLDLTVAPWAEGLVMAAAQ
jgi:predicted CxxxxCH...CXXCH cytochrome family protein